MHSIMSTKETGQYVRKIETPYKRPIETPPKTVEIRIGDEMKDGLGNRFKILKKVGKGAAGSVYKIEDERLGLIRALKVLNTSARTEKKNIQRFNREIRLLAKMNDPFILTAYDAVEFEIEGEKITGLIMDYIEDGNLRQIINENGRVSIERVTVIASEVVHALESMRQAKVVHRDLKPDNIFVQKLADGTEIVRVGDFGIAALIEDARIEVFRTAPEGADLEWAEVITDQYNIVGTPEYMGPEMFRKQLPDHRTDLYALGITMYEMIAGRRPFLVQDLRGIVLAHQMDDPPSFKEIDVKDVPKWLEEIVVKLLEKNPKDRYQTAMEVYVALREGAKKDYPELLTKIPFVWNSYDSSSPGVS